MKEQFVATVIKRILIMNSKHPPFKKSCKNEKEKRGGGFAK